MSNPASTTYQASYLDFAEVWQYLQFPGSPAAQQQNMLQRYIDAACAYAQGPEGANRPIAPTEFLERHDGWSGEYILLHHSPFIKLVACTEWQSSGGPIPLVESTPANPVEGIQIDYATSKIMRTFAGYSWPRPFFPGSRNIEVTYIAGFNPLPPDIWRATMNLIKWWWNNEQQAMRSEAPTPAGAEYNKPTGDPMPEVPPAIASVFGAMRPVTIG